MPSYQYDADGHLLQASQHGLNETFEFDPAGNPLEIAPEDGRPRRFAQIGQRPERRPHALLGNLLKRFLDRDYAYDARGNLIRSTREAGVAKTYQWDASNRLREVRQGETRTLYYYDALGRRIAKTHYASAHEAPHHTYYGWNGNQLALELTANEKVHYLYLGDGFEPVAQERTWMGEPLHWTGGPLDPNHPEYIDPDQPSEAYERTHRYYYHVDHIGTPIEVTDEAGHVAWHAQYKAWGEAKEVLSATAKRAGFKNPLRFQGQYHDEESGLHYNRFRYYDPELGRYISEDPIRLRGGLNTYQYAPNPVEWVDSLGLAGFSPDQRALLEITKDVSKNGPIDSKTAYTLLDWGAEVNQGAELQVKVLDHRFDSGNNYDKHYVRDKDPNSIGHIHINRDHISCENK